MKFKEWLLLLGITSIITLVANRIGYQIPILEAIPGILILCGITLIGVLLEKIVPIELPMIMYVSLLGLILASPISPISVIVHEYTDKIAFMAPVTAVGAFTGISMGKDFKEFKRQSWKMLIIGILVITGTFLFSAIIANIVLSLTKAI